MGSFEEEGLVPLLRHLPRRVPDALERAAVERERHRFCVGLDGQRDHLTPVPRLRPLDPHRSRRFKPVEGCRDLVDRLFRDLLPLDHTLSAHSEE